MSWVESNKYRSTCKSWGRRKKKIRAFASGLGYAGTKSDVLGTFVERKDSLDVPSCIMTEKVPFRNGLWRGAARTAFAVPLCQKCWSDIDFPSGYPCLSRFGAFSRWVIFSLFIHCGYSPYVPFSWIRRLGASHCG
jgi:hypothetical protein